ncbi:MAB family class A beta-lactamase [Pseudonocardia halophobica]|uniref:Beta-lactamase n=1 Tax=Pseudonocardia halophobica TaxID=29401 RepID=A0A9W6P0E7_9PSEU|nr:class A beta-lactamase [Pseudonocardia halophobica]GLL15557.1 beta-lactamase [Pseudonocardia halophobica]
MIASLPRRAVLFAGLAGLGALATGCADPPATPTFDPAPAQAELADLERRAGGRLGVSALDTGSGAALGHRADERFLLCSTGKLLAAAAILHRRQFEADRDILERVVPYTSSVLVPNSPETGKHTSMTVGELCHAAMTLSDNTAMNLLLGVLGGPEKVTAFLRSAGDPVSRLDRTETALNARDGDLDTSTPARMAANTRLLALDDGLTPDNRDVLVGWLKANTTGVTRIRAGLPADWVVGDKTGAGARGEINDVAVVWPPGRAPLVIAVYTEPPDPDADAAPTVAEAARIVARSFA